MIEPCKSDWGRVERTIWSKKSYFCKNSKFEWFWVKLMNFENNLWKLDSGCILYMGKLKTCSFFTQNLGCVSYMSASYTRDGTVLRGCACCGIHSSVRSGWAGKALVSTFTISLLLNIMAGECAGYLDNLLMTITTDCSENPPENCKCALLLKTQSWKFFQQPFLRQCPLSWVILESSECLCSASSRGN